MTLGCRVSKAAQAVRSAWKGPVPWIAVLVAAVVISLLQYGWTLDEPFRFGDRSRRASDTALFLGHLREGQTLTHLSESWGPTQYYRPAAYLWIAGNYAVWGERAWGFRASIMVLHLLSLGLLGLLTSRVAGSRAPGLAAALAFAFLGPHHAALTWVWAVHDPLCGVFYLAALLALGAARRPWIWAPALAAGALGAKESAMTLPVVATLWTALGVWQRDRPRLAAVGLLWALLAGYILLRYQVLGVVVPSQVGYDTPWRLALWNYGNFLAGPLCHLIMAPRLFLLSGWTLLYGPFWDFALEQVVFWFCVVLLVKRCPRAAAAFLLWKVVVYLPVLRYVLRLSGSWHYLYLPSMGNAMLLGLVGWQGWPILVGWARRIGRAMLPRRPDMDGPTSA